MHAVATGSGFATCSWPIWRVDDFTLCFQRKSVQPRTRPHALACLFVSPVHPESPPSESAKGFQLFANHKVLLTVTSRSYYQP